MSEAQAHLMVRTGIPVFDSATGGLAPGANCLLYGELGVGKSTFALQFLAHGLKNDESAILVTRRIGRDVLQHAEAFGFPLEQFVRSGQLLILEYSADVIERAARAREFTQIADEFDCFARGRRIQRIVFDPLTPLVQGMNIGEVSFRTRSLVQRLGEYRAIVLFLLDLPEASDVVPSCKDLMQAVLRFEVPSGPEGHATLVMERLPQVTNGYRNIRYSLELGRGIVEAPSDGAANGDRARRKILLPASDSSGVEPLGQMLADEYSVAEYTDIIEAVLRLAAESFDLLIVEADPRDNVAVRACLELRKKQFNLPILLLVKGQQKRLRDRLALLAQGIDDCLETPVDGRLLRVRVHSLLKRYSAQERFREYESDQVVLDGLKSLTRDAGIVADAEVFRACLEQEVGNAQQFSVPFTVCILDLPSSSSEGSVLSAAAIQRLVRAQDTVYANCQAVAVLLSEANENGAMAFLRRLPMGSDLSTRGQVRTFTFDRSPDFVRHVLSQLPEPFGSASEFHTEMEAT